MKAFYIKMLLLLIFCMHVKCDMSNKGYSTLESRKRILFLLVQIEDVKKVEREELREFVERPSFYEGAVRLDFTPIAFYENFSFDFDYIKHTIAPRDSNNIFVKLENNEIYSGILLRDMELKFMNKEGIKNGNGKPIKGNIKKKLGDIVLLHLDSYSLSGNAVFSSYIDYRNISIGDLVRICPD